MRIFIIKIDQFKYNYFEEKDILKNMILKIE